MRGIAGALALGAAIAGYLSMASAQEAGAGWQTVCGEGDRCTALLGLKDDKTGNIFASIGLQVGKGGSEPAIIAFVPLGVELKPGFRAVVAGQAFEAPYEVCLKDGCRAVGAIPAEALQTWLGADSVSVQFFPFGSDKPVAADAPLAGLREALATSLGTP